MQIRAAASQPPVPRTTAVSSHGHLSVRGYDDNDDEDDGDDIATETDKGEYIPFQHSFPPRN